MPQHFLALLTAQVLAFAAEEPDDIVSVLFEQCIRCLRSRCCGQGEHQVVLSRELCARLGHRRRQAIDEIAAQ
jgi:hypothetical protein